MLTAQWLLGGESIYWTSAGAWSENFVDGAILIEQAEADSALASAQEFVKQRIIVAPYLIEVEVDAAGPQPISARERIRAAHNATFDIDHGSWATRISD